MSHFREKKESIFETLLDSITVGALRDIYISTTDAESIPQDKNNKESLQQLIRTSGVPKDVLTDLMFEEEASRPYKHVFFSRWNGSVADVKNCYQGLSGHTLPLENLNGVSNLKCDHVKDEVDKIIFTFSHDARSTFWEWRDGGRFPENVTVRHPLIVTLDFSHNLFISYPGFTPSREIENELDYYDILKQILVCLKNSLSIDYQPYPIRKVVETFLAEDLKRVRFVRIKSDHERGGMEFVSNSYDMPIENLLPGLMLPYLPNGISEEQIKYAMIKAIKDCNISSSVLYWEEECIATKIRYFELGSELFITWTGVEPNYSIVRSAVDFLKFIALKFETEATSVLEFFIKDKTQKVFTKADIASLVSFESSKLDLELVGLMVQRVLAPMYRLKTSNQILNYRNEWISNPTLLRKKFELENHQFFDGSVPANIEVGFQYVKSGY